MKQKLLNSFKLRAVMLVALLCATFTGTAWADKIIFADLGLENGVQYTDPFDGGDFTVTFAGGANDGKYYTTGSGIRVYGGGTMTIASDTKTITSITLSYDGSNKPSSGDVVDNGTYNSTTGVWTGSATSIVFTRPSGSGHWRVKSIEVAYASSANACATPTFSPEAGAYPSAQNVTISTETTGATIYYTTDGTDPTTSSSVYSSAIEVSSTTTIKAMATATNYDDSSVASAAYTIVNLEHAGTLADPYTVADARTAIDAGIVITEVYVAGIVCTGGSSLSNGALNYWISDDGTETDKFEVYKGKGINDANFNSTDDIQEGDVVVVKGNLTKYNTTYEFSAGSQLVSLDRPVTPSISADNVNIEYNATSGSIDFTINNETQDGVLTAAITAGNEGSWLSLGTVTTSVPLTCTANEGNADRTATVTLTYTYNTNETVTKAVTVTQKHYVADYATLPFSFTGGRSAIGNTVGLTESGLGTDYGDSNAPLKFDGTGDYVILKINERPGTLTFNIKNNSFSGGTFKLQTSEDGSTYTDHKSYTEISGTQSEEIKDLGENVRYIKWIYTNKSSGNVGLGNISLAKYVAPANYDLSVTLNDGISAIHIFNVADQNNPLIANGAAGTVQVTNGTEIMVSPDVADGYVLQSLTVDGDDVTNQMDESGAYTFTMPNHAVTIAATAIEYVAPQTVTYTLATTLKSGKTYVIAGSAEDGNVQVMGEQKSNNRGTVEGTVSGTTLSVMSDAGACEVVVYGPDAAGNYTFSTAEGYLYAASSSSNNMKSQATNDANGKWSVSIDSNEKKATVVAQGNNSRKYMRFNSTLFSCYAENSSIVAPVYFFEKAGDPVATTTSVTLNGSGYATYSSTGTLDFLDYENASYSAWQIKGISGETITFEQVTSTIAAGTGLLLKDTPSTTVNLNILPTGGATLSGNKLVGITEATAVTDGQYFGLKGNEFVPVNGGTVPAGKALLPANVVPTEIKAFTFVFESVDGIKTVEHVSAKEAAEIFNLAGQRLQKAQRGVNIINGKKVLVK